MEIVFFTAQRSLKLERKHIKYPESFFDSYFLISTGWTSSKLTGTRT